jgi:hypothetical protein
MKILAFGASTSSTSINRQLANHAARQVPEAQITNLDLATFDLPTYSSDEEGKNGIPMAAQRFLETIRAHDAIVISMAEHNGSYLANREQAVVAEANAAVVHVTGCARRGFGYGNGCRDLPSHGSGHSRLFQSAIFL